MRAGLVLATLLVSAVLMGVVYGLVSRGEPADGSGQAGGGHIVIIPERPPKEYRGPAFFGEAPGLKVAANLSEPSVRVGGTLWIRVVFKGEKAYSIDRLWFIIVDSEGRIVTNSYVVRVHPPIKGKHPESPIHIIAWKAERDATSEVDVMPGTYTFMIKTVDGELLVKGTIRVTG